MAISKSSSKKVGKTHFTVDITFTGIMAIVPDREDEPKKLALILPTTDSMKPTCTPAQDGKPRFRHRWFIEFDPRQLTKPAVDLPPNTLAHWNLSDLYDFRRITFESDCACDLDVGNSLDYVCELDEVAKDFAEMPSSCLSWGPGREVMGQIMFDRGQLVEPDDERSHQWIFPPTLSRGKTHDAFLHHNLYLRLENVTSFAIVARESKVHPAEKLTFNGESGAIKITISNLCDDNPLRWPNLADPRVDHDFRWYFELSSRKNALGRNLNGLDLPVPHPAGELNALGQNCLETRFRAQDFKLD